MAVGKFDLVAEAGRISSKFDPVKWNQALRKELKKQKRSCRRLADGGRETSFEHLCMRICDNLWRRLRGQGRSPWTNDLARTPHTIPGAVFQNVVRPKLNEALFIAHRGPGSSQRALEILASASAELPPPAPRMASLGTSTIQDSQQQQQGKKNEQHEESLPGQEMNQQNAQHDRSRHEKEKDQDTASSKLAQPSRRRLSLEHHFWLSESLDLLDTPPPSPFNGTTHSLTGTQHSTPRQQQGPAPQMTDSATQTYPEPDALRFSPFTQISSMPPDNTDKSHGKNTVTPLRRPGRPPKPQSSGKRGRPRKYFNSPRPTGAVLIARNPRQRRTFEPKTHETRSRCKIGNVQGDCRRYVKRMTG